MTAEHSGGSGPDLVLLHGLGSRWQVFAPILDALEADHRVLALDLPGFGARASDPSLRPGIPGLADWVGAELETRGITSPHLVGSSMGAAIALELAHRGIAGRVTAFAPVGFWSTPERVWCARLLTVLRTAARSLQRPLGRALRTRMGRRLLLFPLFGKPTRVEPDAAVGDLDALATCDGFTAARDSFHTLPVVPAADDVPTTIVWGRRDLVLPALAQSRRARRRWSRAHHVLLGGCGHLPFSDAPDRCVAAILSRHDSALHRQDTR